MKIDNEHPDLLSTYLEAGICELARKAASDFKVIQIRVQQIREEEGPGCFKGKALPLHDKVQETFQRAVERIIDGDFSRSSDGLYSWILQVERFYRLTKIRAALTAVISQFTITVRPETSHEGVIRLVITDNFEDIVYSYRLRPGHIRLEWRPSNFQVFYSASWVTSESEHDHKVYAQLVRYNRPCSRAFNPLIGKPIDEDRAVAVAKNTVKGALRLVGLSNSTRALESIDKDWHAKLAREGWGLVQDIFEAAREEVDALGKTERHYQRIQNFLRGELAE